MEITVLCKVVDNFGDIGVMLRLVNRLLFINPEIEKINVIIDNLSSFNKIWNKVNSEEDFQQLGKIFIYNWNNNELCYKEFSRNDGEKLSIILELFQCGRPDWLEKILFEDELQRTVQIIMIDYLTAEKYAEDFHKLMSLTRKAKVKKVNFMPGFTDKTGGLIIDEKWKELSEYNSSGNVLIFTYEGNWNPLAAALCKGLKEDKKILVAQGRGQTSFVKAYENQKTSSPELLKMDYVNQEDWDEILKKCSMLVIRGEESMSRACLSGIPFIWHAYPQSDEYQLVKVNALLDCMEKHFNKENFEIVKAAWQTINNPEVQIDEDEKEKIYLDFIKSVPQLVEGFNSFAKSLIRNGDLATNLMTFINQICIMK